MSWYSMNIDDSLAISPLHWFAGGKNHIFHDGSYFFLPMSCPQLRHCQGLKGISAKTAAHLCRSSNSDRYVKCLLVGGLEHSWFFHILGITIATDPYFSEGWLNHQPGLSFKEQSSFRGELFGCYVLGNNLAGGFQWLSSFFGMIINVSFRAMWRLLRPYRGHAGWEMNFLYGKDI